MDKLSLALIGPREPVMLAARHLLDYTALFQSPLELKGLVIPEQETPVQNEQCLTIYNNWKKFLNYNSVQLVINLSEEQSLKRELRHELDLKIQLLELNEKQIQDMLSFGSEDRIKPVLSHIPYPTLLTRADGNITFVNNSVYQLSLFEDINFVFSKSKNLFELFPDLEQHYRARKESDQEFVSKSISLSLEDQQWEFTFIQVPSPTTPPNIVWSVQNLQDEEKEKRLDTTMAVIGAISHELSQPITAIVNSVQLLLSTPHEKTDRLKRHKEIISSESERIFELYSKLRTINKYKLKNYLGTQIFDIENSSDFELTMPHKNDHE